MNKWYQEIIVLNKEIDGSMFYCFDEENHKKISDDREEQLKEIERLNNIINELEKYLNEQVDYMTHHSIERMVAFDCCRHRLQELKGSEKEWK